MGADRTPGGPWGLEGDDADPWAREVAAPVTPPPARFAVPAEPAPSGPAPSGPAPSAPLPPDPDDEDPWSPSRWRRWVAIAAVVGLAAAFGIVLVGGGEGRGDPDGEPSAPPSRPDERPAATAPPAATEPPTTVAATTVASTVVAPAVVDGWPVDDGPAIRLAVLAGSTLSTVDLASGDVTPIRGVDPPASSAPTYLVAARGAYTALSWDRVDGFRLNADGTYAVIPADDQAGGPLLAGPIPGTVWELPVEEGGFARLVDVTGRPQGPMVLPRGGEILGSAGDGRLLLDGPGGVYRIDVEQSPQRVTTGELIAVGPGVAFARECDERFSCDGVRIDLTTGERTAAPPDIATAAPLDGLGGWPDGSTVSPDGDVVLVRRRGIARGWAFIDLAAGTTVGIAEPVGLSPIVWSPDSAFVVLRTTDGIQLFDRQRGEAIAVPVDDVVAFAPIVDGLSG